MKKVKKILSCVLSITLLSIISNPVIVEAKDNFMPGLVGNHWNGPEGFFSDETMLFSQIALTYGAKARQITLKNVYGTTPEGFGISTKVRGAFNYYTYEFNDQNKLVAIHCFSENNEYEGDQVSFEYDEYGNCVKIIDSNKRCQIHFSDPVNGIVDSYMIYDYRDELVENYLISHTEDNLLYISKEDGYLPHMYWLKFDETGKLSYGRYYEYDTDYVTHEKNDFFKDYTCTCEYVYNEDGTLAQKTEKIVRDFYENDLIEKRRGSFEEINITKYNYKRDELGRILYFSTTKETYIDNELTYQDTFDDERWTFVY